MTTKKNWLQEFILYTKNKKIRILPNIKKKYCKRKRYAQECHVNSLMFFVIFVEFYILTHVTSAY